MKNLINKSRENWLIIASLVLYIIFIILQSQISYSDFNKSSRLQIDIPFFLFLFIGVIIAPILEEVFFRGLFTNGILNKIVSLFFPFIVLFYLNDNYNITFKIILVFFGLICTFISLSSKSQGSNLSKVRLLSVTNALLFSIVHYSETDFYQLATILPMISQFSLGLLFIWITINFGLSKSILVHFIYNFILFSFLFIGYQTVDTKSKRIENPNFILEWKKNKILDSNYGYVKNEKKKLTIENLGLKNSMNYLIMNDSIKKKIFIKDYFQKYSIKIESKSDSLDNEDIIYCLNYISNNE